MSNALPSALLNFNWFSSGADFTGSSWRGGRFLGADGKLVADIAVIVE
jgi:hypothetical protein